MNTVHQKVSKGFKKFLKSLDKPLKPLQNFLRISKFQFRTFSSSLSAYLSPSLLLLCVRGELNDGADLLQCIAVALVGQLVLASLRELTCRFHGLCDVERGDIHRAKALAGFFHLLLSLALRSMNSHRFGGEEEDLPKAADEADEADEAADAHNWSMVSSEW